MSIQGAINQSLGVAAAASTFGKFKPSGPSPAEVERLNEQWQVRQAQDLERKRQQAIADMNAKRAARESQQKEFEAYKQKFKSDYGILAGFSDAARKSWIEQDPVLRERLMKAKEMEDKINEQ